MKKINQKATIFDLDGTLIDSKTKLVKDVVETMQRLGVKISPEETNGNWYKLAKEYGFSREEFDKELNKRMTWEEALQKGIVKIFPETHTVLDYLTSKGTKMALLSRSSLEYTHQKLNHFGLNKYFHQVAITNVEAESKSPEAIEIVKVFNPESLEKVYCIGDQEEDVAISQAIQDTYHLNSSGIWVNRTGKNLDTQNKYHIVQSLEEISEIMGV